IHVRGVDGDEGGSQRQQGCNRFHCPLPFAPGRVHFLSDRTCAMSALISSSLNLSLKGFIFSLPSSFKPSLTAANILSSCKPAWYWVSVWSFTPAILPALVWPLPSLPWQDAQCFVQLAWTSAALQVLTKRKGANVAARRNSFFMASRLLGFVFGWAYTQRQTARQGRSSKCGS